MKRLREFEYYEPASLDEAVQLLSTAGDGARVLAGGTDLVVDMKTGRMRPSTVVNLKGISGLSGVEDDGGGTRIGALTKVPVLEASPLVQQRHPALAQAASILASPPVRALATIGGNVGRASPAADLGPALMVHDAHAIIAGVGGSRDELVEDLYVGPGETSLVPSDIITHFILVQPPPGFGSAHVKLGKRGSGTDIALAGVSASVVIGDGGVVVDCRIALASLGPTPFRATGTESLLRSKAPTEALLAAAAESASGEAKPIGDMRASASYRTRLARVLTLRALQGAMESACVRVAA
ncbi:MAG: xanthine dehydrogenase family protein subunit M [Acidimicrobiia bacterium]